MENARKPQEHAESFDPAEATAIEIARKNGKVTKKELMEEAGIGKTKATDTLKALADRGVLKWVGTSTNDPRQGYRPIDVS